MDKILYFIKKIIPRRIFFALEPPYHFILAFLAALFYGFPSRRIKVIGVTGTKGKTTVVELLYEILSASGAKVASASSLRFRIGDRAALNTKTMTMPGRFFVQRFLHEAARAGCKYAILEVTSEGIKQYRHRFVKFDTAVITNIAPEHIEAHGGFEKYLRAKLDLFWRLPKDASAVINRDDFYWQRFSAATAGRKVFYSAEAIESGGVRHQVQDLEITEGGISFDLKGVEGVTFRSPLLGEFNFYNILAASAVGLAHHISLEKISEAVSSFTGIPGRMEFIQREPFAAVVDYAHTPDSLKKVYTLLRENPKSKIQNPKLICVLGAAGGGRDKWKRPELGRIAAEFCDRIILTNEDPYDENPQTIIDEIESGFSSVTGYQLPVTKKILDRREAIRGALESAGPGDTVIITGKGSELWIMGPGGERTPWNDGEVIKEELKRLKI